MTWGTKMQQVSSQYKKDIKKSLRNYSYVKVGFRISDPVASANASISWSGRASWSGVPDLVGAASVKNRYGVLEPGMWLLDGSTLTYQAKSEYQGFVSSAITDSLSLLPYSSAIKLTLTFSDYYSFKGLEISFDRVRETYPKSITVKGYKDSAEVFTYNSEVTTVTHSIEQPVPATDYLNKLEFIFTNDRLPYHRLCVEEIILGVSKTFDADTITSVTWSRSNDLLSTVLPSNSLSFSFYDVDREYDPDNPQSVWDYLEKGQQLTFSYGYQLDDGSIEWIQGGKNFTDGQPMIQSSSVLSEVTFRAVSRIDQLVDEYYEGVYSSSGVNLYDLARAVLRWAGCVSSNGDDDFVLHSSLKNYTCFVPLPVLEVRQLLQLIANAALCMLYVNREGVITIAPRTTPLQNFEFTLDDVVDDAPTVNKYPFLKNLYFKLQTMEPDTSVSTLSTINIAGATSLRVVIDYDAATSIDITVSTGLTLNNVVGKFAYRSIVEVTGSGTITVKGKKLITSTRMLSRNFNTIGEDCTVENILVATEAQGNSYIDWMARILQLRNVYSFADRGFPEIDEGDTVQVDTSFTEDKQAIITKSTITYDGALSGDTEVIG